MISTLLYNVFVAASWFLRILSDAMFVYCLLTWFAPRSAVCDWLRRFTDPFVAPFRSLSYKLMMRWGSRLDLSYWFAMIAIRIFSQVLWSVYGLLVRLLIRNNLPSALLLAAAGLGTLLTDALNSLSFGGLHFTFPSYIGAMLTAAAIRNICDGRHIVLPAGALEVWGGVSLSIFLSIALMTLKLWQLAALAGPLALMLAAQTALMFFFARFVVFRLMGRDYEAAVMTSAFCGFGMGATPNAMANMQALTRQYGPAPQAYFIVPLVGSLFIDFINSLIITGFLNVLTLMGQ